MKNGQTLMRKNGQPRIHRDRNTIFDGFAGGSRYRLKHNRAYDSIMIYRWGDEYRDWLFEGAVAVDREEWELVLDRHCWRDPLPYINMEGIRGEGEDEVVLEMTLGDREYRVRRDDEFNVLKIFRNVGNYWNYERMVYADRNKYADALECYYYGIPCFHYAD